MQSLKRFAVVALSFLSLALSPAVHAQEQQWVTYEGKEGPGKGKHIVLISGDEEYRSEESMPAIGKILAVHHGFKCTVLFAIDPKTGEISPNTLDNIPGLEALQTADLMIIGTRFRNLPDGQMKFIDDYLQAGKPVVGFRTATHGFNLKGPTYKHYSNGYSGDKKEWAEGFGRFILGEKWITHHGKHMDEGTRGILAPDAKDHPILKGLKDGDIFGDTDVYGVRLPLPGDSKPLVLGQVTQRVGPRDDKDPFRGMKPTDPPLAGKKNDPMMPVAWTKTYTLNGKTGRVFTTTMGSSTDFSNDGFRRLFINGVYWAVGLEDQISASAKIDFVGEFKFNAYRGGGYVKGVKPADLVLK